jgi:hypothetical protein
MKERKKDETLSSEFYRKKNLAVSRFIFFFLSHFFLSFKSSINPKKEEEELDVVVFSSFSRGHGINFIASAQDGGEEKRERPKRVSESTARTRILHESTKRLSTFHSFIFVQILERSF